jgi:hypothetical protein
VTEPESALKKFTPAGPNRDVLLYAAGRASARPPARWKWATGLLAVSQAVTLTLWLWPKADVVPLPLPALPPPVVAPDPDPVPPSPPEPYSYLALMYRDPDPEPEPRERFVPRPERTTPPLTAGSRRFE